MSSPSEPQPDPAFASVAIPVPVRRLFSYRLPERWHEHAGPGLRVRVPFGHRRVEGTVVRWPAPPPDEGVEVKTVEAVLPDAPRLPPDILELTRFVSDYYLCSWGEAIETALPPGAGQAPRRDWVRRCPEAVPAEIPARAVARARLLGALPEDGSPVRVQGLPQASRRLIPQLERLGWVERVRRPPSPLDDVPARPLSTRRPTPAQAAVLEQLTPLIDGRSYAASLLFGATGSGKTEVYCRAAQRVLDQGRDVIYLVPEIGLTPLLVSALTRRFPGEVVVMHSALPRRERQRAWELLATGARHFVVGTRSAVFAPVRELGLIVVDEEQDGSYKQDESPRYNGRDLAVLRARGAGAVALLGSATPSMESFRHARAGRYALLELGGRLDQRPLATVELVDMREEYRRRSEVTPVSLTLLSALEDCLGRGEQALVLRNRRGWSAAVFCPACGDRVTCNRCSISLTWHRRERRLRCHYCDFELPFPALCPGCGAEDLKLQGEGTEQVEQIIQDELPTARVARMDRDALRTRGAHERLLRGFERGEIDVLVGTQMIAKGHDFPRVTLVGVISADHSLGLPDFRAGERTFQLLTQVAGRAGRGERPGRVVAQAWEPEHPLLRYAAAQDYEGFFDREIDYRRALRYPPLTAMVQIMILDRQEHRAREWAAEVAAALREESGGRLLLAGPGPAPIERIRGRYRQQILARSAGRRRLVETVDRALTRVEGRVPRRAIHVDVDPLSVL